MVLLFRFKALRTTTGPYPLPLHKGGEYNVLLMWGKSVVTTPSPCGRVGEGSGGSGGRGNEALFYRRLCLVAVQ